MIERKRRLRVVVVIALVAAAFNFVQQWQAQPSEPLPDPPPAAVQGDTTNALDVLSTIPVKGRAPKTDYSREQFGAGWADVDDCDMRNIILQRDLQDTKLAEDGCTVLSGQLADPYTGERISFTRGQATSSQVQIDHVVALSDAWQKGAQSLDVAVRTEFANDPLNLLAVSGTANQSKSDADAASWLPPDRDYRCRFVARQLAVKQKYDLWITQAEHNAMRSILERCPDQILPIQLLPEQSYERIP